MQVVVYLKNNKKLEFSNVKSYGINNVGFVYISFNEKEDKKVFINSADVFYCGEYDNLDKNCFVFE